jgi:hypothetical protein
MDVEGVRNFDLLVALAANFVPSSSPWAWHAAANYGPLTACAVFKIRQHIQKPDALVGDSPRC